MERMEFCPFCLKFLSPKSLVYTANLLSVRDLFPESEKFLVARVLLEEKPFS